MIKFVLLLLLGLTYTPAEGAWTVDPPYYGQYYAGMGGVRGLWVDPSGDLLAEARGHVHVVYEEDNGDGTIAVRQVEIITAAGLNLNHGVTFHDGHIYASSAVRVFRWPYTPGSRTVVPDLSEIVVNNIPSGGHDTRSMIFDPQGRLIVTVGSGGNVDQNSNRARIRRCTLAGQLPIQFEDCEVYIDGLRNEVGLAYDLNGVLHGVGNGADQLNRPDIGGDIHNGNPAEEFNRFDRPTGQHYGYPYCFSTHNLAGYPKGEQFAWPSFLNDGIHDDAWCRNVNNNQPPLIAMPAHTAPLGLDFYKGQNCDGGNGAFPCSVTGDAFVALHGSWNSDIPVGYKVAWYPFSNGEPTGEEKDMVYDPDTSFRAVNAVFNNNGHLLVSADGNGFIIKVTYGMPAKPIRND
ncbi:L-sorbosone dehydrogenase [Folsomia candida]|nr:L-sorbosone dehydrogenase [Folsomia candida]